MARVIGVRLRVKKTADGEASPTQLAVLEDADITTLDLKTEDDELAFVKALQANDQVVMILGGSGDNFAFAAARHGQDVGAEVFRISPFKFQEEAGEDRNKDKDAVSLVQLFSQKPDLFYRVEPRDLGMIWLRECRRALTDAMKNRIACEQRLRQHLIGSVFCSPEGFYPEGKIEQQFDDLKANDVIYNAIQEEEEKRDRELKKALEALEIYRRLFKPIEGCGPSIASRLLTSIVDIRRFETKHQFRTFCGVGLTKDGKFPRKRRGEISNWNPEARQALYLFGDQFAHWKPNSPWGLRYKAEKRIYRARHPEIVMVNGKKRYTDGHIAKMAMWKTMGKFAEWLFKEWWRLEKELQTFK